MSDIAMSRAPLEATFAGSRPRLDGKPHKGGAIALLTAPAWVMTSPAAAAIAGSLLILLRQVF